jgi:disulfide bond formation protein DsbB
VIITMFKGSGSCAEIQWTFLSLSIAGWSFVLFSFLALYCLRLSLVRTKMILV